ncbi:hypothetical protein ACS0TY_005655 [Phlomoides rotata]
MDDQKNLADALVSKPRKKKALPQYPVRSHTFSHQKGQKAPKRGATNEVSPAPDSGIEYRALRRKYLLLEEESFGLGRELKEVEDDIKNLEDEKLSLLDELVVLEGLIDPSDLQSQPQRFQ